MTTLLIKSPRILVSWYAPPDVIPPIWLTADQVNCGPQSEKQSATPKYRFHTPRGRYDLAQAVADANAPQEYDLIVVFSDASLSNLPSNLGSFQCPKLLIAGDTHHLQKPIQRMLGYARSEPFDFVASSYNRQHLHWFAEAGMTNVGWFPGAIVRHIPRPMVSPRKPLVAMIGQLGKYHPRRTRLVKQLKEIGIPTIAGMASRERSADAYAQSTISLNCSLNGDLNLRNFEVLSAGGFLLTDRLAEASGIDLLFEDGAEFATYSSEEELLEKARHFLSHPEEAAAIAARGHHRYLQEHLPQMKAAAILRWVFEGQLDGIHDPHVTLRHSKQSSTNEFSQRIVLYESVQQTHAELESIRVLLEATVADRFAADLADLPRVNLFITSGEEQRSVDEPPPRCQACTLATARTESWDFLVWPSENKPDQNELIKATKTVFV